MRLVAIESPLAGDFERNQRYARWCAYDCYMRGEAAYASHLFYTQFLDDRAPAEREFGILAGFEWAQHADTRIFYTDLGMSEGMNRALLKMPNKQLDTFRQLPPGMLSAFQAGESPKPTPGAL